MDIRGQDQAYKRGLVLGLTMAEIVILILFCLLLALAAVFANHRVTIEQQTGRIAELEKAVKVEPETLRLVSVLKEYWERHAPKDVDIREYFSQLVLRIEDLDRLRKEVEQLAEKNRRAEKGVKDAADRAEELEKKFAEAAAADKMLKDSGFDVSTVTGRVRLKGLLGGPGRHDWPPIISLSEADKYNFRTGSAELSPSFHRLLTSEVVPKLLEIVREYDVNVVEVIGHTDEQPIAPRPSNLDQELPRVLGEGAPIAELIPADNAGLGIARALSVARVLTSDPRLAKLTVLALSGGQLTDEDRMTSWARGGNVAARRRIEIRVRRPLVHLDMEAQAGKR